MGRTAGNAIVTDCHCLAFRRAARRVSAFYDEMLAPTGLRVSQFSMLALIGESGGRTINDMAVALGIDRTTTGKNLKPLQTEGLVRIERLERDGRCRIARLTPAGDDTLARATPLWRQAQHRLEERNGGRVIARLKSDLATLAIPDP